MPTLLRILGVLLMVYPVVYLAQLYLATLSDDFLPYWDIINYVSAIGILIALAANFMHMRAQSAGEAPTAERIGAHALFYANVVLAIWFFNNWLALFVEAPGEWTPVDLNVIWHVIAVLIPLVLATTGWRLWQKNG